MLIFGRLPGSTTCFHVIDGNNKGSAMNIIREQGQRIAELEAKVRQYEDMRRELDELKALVRQKLADET